jgi:glycosyltransferase involved in cell wall biosynthesis
MKILLITDAYSPQISGIVRTLSTTIKLANKMGHEVKLVEPSLFRSFPCPFYKDIPLVYGSKGCNWLSIDIGKFIEPPCSIHIATEGSLGFAFNCYCYSRGIPFTTSYHTNFPEYASKYLPFIPKSLIYWYLRWFHNRSETTMVSVPSLCKHLSSKGFNNLATWSRGVDTELFKPAKKLSRKKPVCMYIGRVAAEKNIEAFLNCRNDVMKYVVGDGPILNKLKKKYPDVYFCGTFYGKDLADMYASADCFVFPSKSDTFGLVLLEALSSGVPIAAFPEKATLDIIGDYEGVGCLDDNLEIAIDRALKEGVPEACRKLALYYNWESCTKQFIGNLVEYDGRRKN